MRAVVRRKHTGGADFYNDKPPLRIKLGEVKPAVLRAAFALK